jgi:hypothetical protein
LGAGGNVTPASRDWSLLTQRGAWSVAPVFSTSCSEVDAESRGRAWIGVDAVPGLRHRYRRIGETGALWALAHMGLSWPVRPYLDLGPHLVTNVTAWGAGIHIRYLPAPTNRLGLRGIELRLQGMIGDDPDLQALVLVHLHHRWVGGTSEEEHLQDREGPTGQMARKVRLATGFEVGAVTGMRLEVNTAAEASIDLGVRAGILTNFFADAAVQPIGLLYLGVPVEDDNIIQLESNIGVSRRDGAWSPVFGASFQVDPADSVLKAHLGLVAGIGPDRPSEETGAEARGRWWASIDGGFAWIW